MGHHQSLRGETTPVSAGSSSTKRAPAAQVASNEPTEAAEKHSTTTTETKMERRNLHACLALMFVASALATVVDPRGNRPVVPGTRSEKCASQKEWPFCLDDDWGHKCPSGCRIQGLIDRDDHENLKRIEKIRDLLDQNNAKHRSTDVVSKQTYDYLKDRLTVDSGNDNNYYDLAQNLRQRITDMKVKIDRQLRILAALKDRVKQQVVDMERLEVDIDIKIRSCKGSCSGYAEYNVDRESYVTLEKQVNQLDSHSAQSVESVGTLYVMKSRPLQDAIVDSIYKSGDDSAQVAGQKTEDVFPEVKTVQLVLEHEGSSSSPATISKVPGTSYSPATGASSTSSTSSSSSSTSSSSSSITELGGRGDGDLFSGGFGSFGGPSTTSTQHVSSQKVTCTKSIRRTIVHTKDGPVEKMEEVMQGGPECQSMTDSSKGGMSSIFPDLSHTSSSFSSSSSSSKVVHLGGTKGSITGHTKTGFTDPFGFDLGAFHAGHVEEDVPDFHARSVKSVRVERQADYVGKVCARLKQQNKDGRQSLSGARTYGRQQCRAKSDGPLCSDDDWVSKCPSGCRLQGLMSQMETEVEDKLWEVCQTVQKYKDANEKSLKKTGDIYTSAQRVDGSRHKSDRKFVERAEELSRDFSSLQKRTSTLSPQLQELLTSVQKQMDDLYRAEVDVDMKLRSCRGSCRSAPSFTVDHQSYRTLQTHVDQITKRLNQRSKAPSPPEDAPPLTLQDVDILPAPPEQYTAVQREVEHLLQDSGSVRAGREEHLTLQHVYS